ncbi:MAG: ParA family protein [Chloroflexi bacterium]|nr:ParA family protein [Chloroflexota bacterium]
MITVVVANRKGGVAKTTTAVNLAAALAGAGKKVALVDTDPQGNVAKWFGMPEESGIYNLLIKEQYVGDLLRLVPSEKWWPTPTDGVLVILPGNIRTTTAGVAMAIDETPSDILRNALSPLENSIDVVIVDTAPTVTELMAKVYAAGDYVIIPTATRSLDANGVTKTMGDIAALKKDITLQALCVLPTRHVERQVECQENLIELQQKYGDLVWSPIAERSIVSESPSFGQSVFVRAPRTHKAVREMTIFAGQVLTTLQTRGEL